MTNGGQTFTANDVCRVFRKHGMFALPSSPVFADHARWANDEAKKHGVQAGWNYIYWHARLESSMNEADSVAAAHEAQF
jgi:hypothetical protein